MSDSKGGEKRYESKYKAIDPGVLDAWRAREMQIEAETQRSAAFRHVNSIAFHLGRGMSLQQLERIYGRAAVHATKIEMAARDG